MSHHASWSDDPADDDTGVMADTEAARGVPYALSFAMAHPVRQRPRRRRGRLVLMLASAAALAGALYGLRAPHEAAPADAARAEMAVRQAALPSPRTAPADHGWMLDRRPLLGAQAYALNDAAPLGPALRPTVAQALAANPLAEAAPALAAALAPATAPTPRLAEAKPVRTAPQSLAQVVPLPVQRPAELRSSPVQTAMQTPRPAERRALQSTRSVFQAARTEEPSFLEKIFGGGPSEGSGSQALAYAGTEGDTLALSPRRRLSAVPNPSEGVAVYDITARTVTLPSGERLEAHSGLGEAMDSPRHVHLRMRGSTPPGTYELTEREALFHGVRAIRLNPVGGPGAIYGRVGLLAHTYMLGPKGASNGCISFRNYTRFLQAYLRGEIRRVVVVAGSGDEPPAIGNNRIGRDRLGLNGRGRRTDG